MNLIFKMRWWRRGLKIIKHPIFFLSDCPSRFLSNANNAILVWQLQRQYRRPLLPAKSFYMLWFPCIFFTLKILSNWYFLIRLSILDFYMQTNPFNSDNLRNDPDDLFCLPEPESLSQLFSFLGFQMFTLSSI